MFPGISENQFPSINFTRLTDNLLIIGSGRCVWNDLIKVNQTLDWDVCCINDIIMHYPGYITHAYSNDHHTLNKWVDARRPRYRMDFKENILKHTCQVGRNDHFVWPFPGHGTSALNACYLGIALGYSNIVLAGVPLDNSGHYFDPPWCVTNFINEVPERDGELRYWKDAKENIFNGKIKSLSGRTAELLGCPDGIQIENVCNIKTLRS